MTLPINTSPQPKAIHPAWLHSIVAKLQNKEVIFAILVNSTFLLCIHHFKPNKLMLLCVGDMGWSWADNR